MSLITSISITSEDKRNIEKLKLARAGVPFSHLVRELIAKEVARLEQLEQRLKKLERLEQNEGA